MLDVRSITLEVFVDSETAGRMDFTLETGGPITVQTVDFSVTGYIVNRIRCTHTIRYIIHIPRDTITPKQSIADMA